MERLFGCNLLRGPSNGTSDLLYIQIMIAEEVTDQFVEILEVLFAKCACWHTIEMQLCCLKH